MFRPFLIASLVVALTMLPVLPAFAQQGAPHNTNQGQMVYLPIVVKSNNSRVQQGFTPPFLVTVESTAVNRGTKAPAKPTTVFNTVHANALVTYHYLPLVRK